MGKILGRSNKQRSGNSRKDSLLQKNGDDDSCGSFCGRLALLNIPVLACTFTLLSLYMLAFHLDADIKEVTISTCLSNYKPKITVLVFIFIGATLSFIVTAMRNVQINVYHRRQRSESICRKALNLIAAISNCAAYVGFILLALFDADENGQSRLIHYIGAYMFFVLTGVYGLLHMYLLCQQRQYPVYCKLIFTIVPVSMVACSIMFAINPEGNCVYEWFSVALAAVMIGLVSILFLVDPVDDELREFFCCSRGRGSRKSSSGRSRRDVELA